MSGKFTEILETTFKMEENEGPDKVVGFKEAVKRHIKPGMKLHIAVSYYSPHAMISEIIRQYWRTKPEFTLIVAGVIGNTINLIQSGLVNKVITTYLGDDYPAPRPNLAITRAYREKRLQIEQWSLLTYTMRLMAGAMDIGFIPTNSIMGSTMAEENEESFKVIDDPFGGARKFGLLKALKPDISIVHGWAADCYGNTILLPPYGPLTPSAGALPSKNGVLVSVERIVSTDFIRRHSPFVVIPGHCVKSVSLVPFGAHPKGMSNIGIEEFEAYGEDYDFINDFQRATQDPETHNAWIKEWILDCETHEDYLRKVGYERLLFLKGKADEDSWKYELESLEDKISGGAEYNATEIMAVIASRKIRDKVIENGYNAILAGVGIANLAGWMAYYQLRKENYYVNIMAEVGFLGYTPRPGDPFIFNFGNLPTCKMLTDVENVLGIFVGSEGNRCLGLLGAGQIDKCGNINSTKISEKIYLTGSGGANDVASTACEVMAVVEQSRNRFVEGVPYITCRGDKVKILVSTMGVFEKLGDAPEFMLTQYFPISGLTPTETINRIRENCGWDLKVFPNITEVDAPTVKELVMLRLFDPRGNFIGSAEKNS